MGILLFLKSVYHLKLDLQFLALLASEKVIYRQLPELTIKKIDYRIGIQQVA